MGRVPWCWMGEGGTAGSVGWGGGGQGDDHVNKVRGLCDIMLDGAGQRSWGV